MQQSGGGGMVAPPMGRISEETARQMRAEALQRLQEAQALRQELAKNGRAGDLGKLDEAINEMKQLTGTGPYKNAEQLARIQQDVVAGMAQFEFGLRKALTGEAGEQVFLPGSGEVPAGFRDMVDAYFRSLARNSPGGN
jgi:hypothetical protein